MLKRLPETSRVSSGRRFRAWMSAIYTATTFKGGLTLTVGYRENGLSDSDATEFVGAIESSIKKYC